MKVLTVGDGGRSHVAMQMMAIAMMHDPFPVVYIEPEKEPQSNKSAQEKIAKAEAKRLRKMQKRASLK